jgi:transcriptional regulator with XRE-family HTH domain
VVKRDIQDGRYNSVIEMLRSARVGAKLSQTALAAKLGKRQQFVSKYESGERRLDIIEFVDVAIALEVDVLAVLRRLTI